MLLRWSKIILPSLLYMLSLIQIWSLQFEYNQQKSHNVPIRFKLLGTNMEVQQVQILFDKRIGSSALITAHNTYQLMAESRFLRLFMSKCTKWGNIKAAYLAGARANLFTYTNNIS